MVEEKFYYSDDDDYDDSDYGTDVDTSATIRSIGRNQDIALASIRPTARNRSNDGEDFALATTTSTTKNQSNNRSNDSVEVGDHVYKWCRQGFGLRYQHHGIVVGVLRDDDEGGRISKIVIIDFYLNSPREQRQSLEDSLGTQSNKFSGIRQRMFRGGNRSGSDIAHGSMAGPGGIRLLEITEQADMDEWLKVKYKDKNDDDDDDDDDRANNATTSKKAKITSDPENLVVARANFLFHNPNVLPGYNVMKSNCECVAVWCKTGKWCTLQILTVLNVVTPSYAGVSGGIFAAAAHATTTTIATVPDIGVWGLAGYTKHVTVVTAAVSPPCLAAMGVVGVASFAGLVIKRRQCIKSWSKVSDTLNEEFQVFRTNESHGRQLL
mmetsp:Transcript_16961/g.24893  ORF Transcript_16961/g.24893 Transcript_16961/m.24893 type:complete len:380 (+) Transcript_16961:34-1173(+)